VLTAAGFTVALRKNGHGTGTAGAAKEKHETAASIAGDFRTDVSSKN